MRIDKFLWAVRVYKTRRLSTEACKKGRVRVNAQEVKPGKEIAVGEHIEVKKGPVLYAYKVKEVPKSRVGAKLVAELIEDLTPIEQLEKLVLASSANAQGNTHGRPSKRDRRDLEKFKNAD